MSIKQLRFINMQKGIPDELLPEFILEVKKDTVHSIMRLIVEEGYRDTKNGQELYKRLRGIKNKLNGQIKQQKVRDTR